MVEVFKKPRIWNGYIQQVRGRFARCKKKIVVQRKRPTRICISLDIAGDIMHGVLEWARVYALFVLFYL
jgi:hypothetical protein